MQRPLGLAGLGHQRQFGSGQKKPQIVVSRLQPAAFVALDWAEAAVGPEILHGHNRLTLNRAFRGTIRCAPLFIAACAYLYWARATLCCQIALQAACEIMIRITSRFKMPPIGAIFTGC